MTTNVEVGAIHPKAMPVILTTPDEIETGLAAPAAEALTTSATTTNEPIPDFLSPTSIHLD